MPTCSADPTIGRRRKPRSSGGDCSADWQSVRESAASESLRVCRRRLIEPLRNVDWRPLVFAALWLFIAMVSAFDTYLTVRFHESLNVMELNPLARALLRTAGWQPALLVGIKLFGTVLALGILMLLHFRSRRIGISVAAGVASFQLALLGFLVL
jgi:hypothetical protein